MSAPSSGQAPLHGAPQPAAVRWREIDLPGQGLESLCAALRAEACPWWLDSALTDGRLGGASFAGADPALVVRVFGDRLEIHCRRPVRPGIEPGFHTFERDPLSALRGLLPRLDARDHHLPVGLAFVGGAVGHLGYELAAHTEPVSFSSPPDLGFPDATLLVVDRLVAVDHGAGRAYGIGWGFGEDDRVAAGRAETSLQAVDAWLARADVLDAPGDPPGGPSARSLPVVLGAALPERARTSLGSKRYRSAVDCVIGEIEAGNVYEANLTRRISIDFDGDAFALYRALRAHSPAPFACFMALPEGAILSSSPERFLRLAPDGFVESRPIKGTRPRAEQADADAALARDLVRSEKDRAENLMIVDLVRNDLGRVCEIGSVQVPELMVVERYASVFQLVSTVTGRLRRECDRIDLLRACFPPGSMTGAPKIAAMRLIDAIEPVRRGVYSGAIGYFDVRGGLDLSVVIRTLVVAKGQAHLHVGGAIVADSDAAAEEAETLDKARGMLAALAALEEPEGEPTRNRGRIGRVLE